MSVSTMCGICGVVYSHRERSVDSEMLDRMTQILLHRGPDHCGFHIGEGVGFGIRRLSIIDLETGDQPISNEDETVTVVCNGEIYNFKELRDELESSGHRFRTKSDVEVIVHLYEIYGVECLSRLRGMFGLALWDQRKRKLLLARDRLGIKPLFYALGKDALFFGSEQKSILMSGAVERQPDSAALQELLRDGYVTAPRTLFRKISHLLPGHFLTYQNGILSVGRYWEPRFPLRDDRVPKRSAEEWAAALKAKLEESVRIHLRSDVPVGAFLSGGLDSSAIVSLMRRLSDQPIQTFSIAFENPNFDEVSGKRILSDFPKYELQNQRVTCRTRDAALISKSIWHREDPTSITVDIPLMMVSELASRSLKVVLTGEGSDELFGGYAWFRTEKLLRPFLKLPLSLRKTIANLPTFRKRLRLQKLLVAPARMNLARSRQLMHISNTGFDEEVFSPAIREDLSNDGDSGQELPLPADFYGWHPFAQLQYFEITARLPNLITRNLDSASMAHSVEARVPFLDHELMEFCAAIPPPLKMRGFQEKHILRSAMRQELPPEILQRKKRGLIPPFSQWILNLPAFAEDLLSISETRRRGYFDPESVSRMLKTHHNGNGTYAKSLMCVLGVHLWDELLARGCKPDVAGDQQLVPVVSGRQGTSDSADKIGLLMEISDRNARQIFVHTTTSIGNASDILKTKPELECYPERALLLARKNDIVCVLDSVDEEFLSFLSSLDIGPGRKNILAVPRTDPKNGGANLTSLLASNREALQQLRRLVGSGENLILNPYVVSAREVELASVIEKILGTGISMQGGNLSVVEHMSLKGTAKAKAVELGVPVPCGEIVELKWKENENLDLTPIQQAIERQLSDSPRVIIRGNSGSSGSTVILVENNPQSLRSALNAIQEKINNIYLIEPMLDFAVSPNIQMYVEPDPGRISCVAISDQILNSGMRHLGNVYPSQARTLKEMVESARTMSKWMQTEGYNGIAGFDFVEHENPRSGELKHFLVEINPRINASTYPKSLMESLNQKQGKGRPQIKAFLSAVIKTREGSFLQLQKKYGHLFYRPETGKGLFPYNIGCLKYGKFMMAIFGESRTEVVKMYNDFLSLVDRA